MSASDTSAGKIVGMDRFSGAIRRLARVFRSPLARVGLAIVGIWILLAIAAPWIAPYPPNAQIRTPAGMTPSADHWLGTDLLWRDILSRILWGARPVLTVAPTALFVAYVVGICMGLAAGYFRGVVDMLISRFVDILLSFPKIVVYVILIATIGPSALNIVVAVVLVASPGIARIARGLALDIMTKDYILAARTRGEGALYIMFAEILPNARGPLIVDACMRMGYTIIAIGVLGFLGLGLPPPDADWGGMVREATSVISVLPHMAIFPSLAIISLVLGFNMLGEGLPQKTS